MSGGAGNIAGASGTGGSGGATGTAGTGCPGSTAGTAGAASGSSGSRLYAILNGGTASSSLEIVDAVSWTLIRNVSIGVRSVTDLEVDPSGQRIFITGSASSGAAGATGNLHTLSSATGADTGDLGPPNNYGALALSPDGTRLYALRGSSSFAAIDAIATSNLTVSDSLSMTDGFNPKYDFTLSPDGKTIAMIWAPPIATSVNVRFIDAACKLSVSGTASVTDPILSASNDLTSPVFTGDGGILLYDTN
jgi:hypothetical protein